MIKVCESLNGAVLEHKNNMKKHNNLTGTKIQNNTQTTNNKGFVIKKSYASKRLSKYAIGNKLNAIDANRFCFDIDKFDNIIINYYDLEGREMVYYLPPEKTGRKYQPERVHGDLLSSEIPEVYTRKRLSPSHLENLSKSGRSTPKYLSPKYSTSKPYLTPLYQFFINSNTKKFDIDFSKIYIVEGEFKAWSMCANGFPAIGISGIHMSIINTDQQGRRKKEAEKSGSFFKKANSNFLPEIQEIIEKFNVQTIVQMHDTDALENENNTNRASTFLTSILDAKNACNALNIHHVYCHGVTTNEKGIDDLLLNRSEEKDNILLDLTEERTGQYFNFYNETNQICLSFFPIEKEYDNVTKFEIDDKIGMDTKVNASILAVIEQAKNEGVKDIIIDASTGLGKSTFTAVNFPNATLTVPYILQAEQNTAKFPQLENIVYDSSVKRKRTGTLIIDECHHLTLDQSYRAKAVKNVFDAAADSPQRIWLSGTPIPFLHHFEKKPYKHIQIRKKEPKIFNASFEWYYKSYSQDLINDLLNNEGVQVVFIGGSKSKVTAKKLEKSLIFKGKTVALINTDERGSKQWETITKEGVLLDGIDVFLVNCVIEDGVDIYTKGVTVRFVGVSNPTSIIQFSNRFRSDTPPIIIYQNEEKKGNASPFKVTLESLRVKAQKLCDDANANTEQLEKKKLVYAVQKMIENGDIKDLSFANNIIFNDITGGIHKNMIIFSKEENKYIVDEKGLICELEKEKVRHYTNNPKQLQDTLEKEHFIFKDTKKQDYTEDLNKYITKEEIKGNDTIYKNESIERQNEMIKLIDEYPEFCIYYMQKKYKSIDPKHIVKDFDAPKSVISLGGDVTLSTYDILKIPQAQKLVKNYISLTSFPFHFSHKDAITILDSVRATRKMNTLRKKWAWATYNDYAANDELFNKLPIQNKKIIERLYLAFPIGTIIKKDEETGESPATILFNQFKFAFKNFRFLKIGKWSKVKVMQILNNAFILDMNKKKGIFIIESRMNFDEILADFGLNSELTQKTDFRLNNMNTNTLYYEQLEFFS